MQAVQRPKIRGDGCRPSSHNQKLAAARPEATLLRCTTVRHRSMTICFLPNEITHLPTKCTLGHFFTFCPDPPILGPGPFCPAFYVCKASGSSVDLGPGQLKALVQMEGDRRLFTVAATLLPRRTQPMADNYLGRQSRTDGGPIYFTRPFQVPDTRTARGQHGPAARQSHVRIPANDSFRAETRNTSLKLCREADCTICSAKHTDTD